MILAQNRFLYSFSRGSEKVPLAITPCFEFLTAQREKYPSCRSPKFVSIGSNDLGWFLSRGAPSSKTPKRATPSVGRVRVFDALLLLRFPSLVKRRYIYIDLTKQIKTIKVQPDQQRYP